MYPIYNFTVEHNVLTANVLVCFIQENILINEVDALYLPMQGDWADKKTI